MSYQPCYRRDSPWKKTLTKEEIDERFCKEFFEIFQIRTNIVTGELYFQSALNRNTLYTLERWFNSNKDIIEYNIGVRFPLVSFSGKSKEEINDILLDLYGLCYTTYLKICV